MTLHICCSIARLQVRIKTGIPDISPIFKINYFSHIVQQELISSTLPVFIGKMHSGDSGVGYQGMYLIG